MNNLLSSESLSKEAIEEILQKADSFLGYNGDDMKGKILANLFYEPSTRTRLSFETAMKRLGGEVISVTDMESTSAMKGETLDDTAKVISQFADIVAIRHPESGSATRFANNSKVPVINAGDGAGQHPSQGLLDLFTIKKEKGKLDGLKIVMSGDLKYSRCTNSLAYLLANYDVEFVFVAPDQLKMKPEVLEYLDEKGVKYSETDDFKEGIKDADVLYCTRIQKERFADSQDYEELKDVYILNKILVEERCPECIVMHPLPRVHEISHDVDDMPNAAYFKQVENGVAVRMAILTMLLA
ncbi:aspartate carbamoyltransferase [Patescibacteria group bacterium]